MHRWSEGDDLAAFFVFRYGTTALPYSIETIAEHRGIGTDSFRMRVRNFKAAAGEGGLKNYSRQTADIYRRFGRAPMEELRRIAFPELCWVATVTSCSFCRTEAPFLAEGPDVSICESCVDAAIDCPPRVDVRSVCSFCSTERNILLTNAANDVRICSECIPLARDVVEHQRTNAMKTPRS